MKIASYNVQSGGFAAYETALTEPVRIEALRAAIKEIDADFISLIDTFRWETYYTPDQISKLFNYPHVFCIPLDDDRLKELGHDNGITVLSRTKPNSSKIVRIHSRNAVKTSISFKELDLNLWSLYLDDLSEETRLKQIEALFKNEFNNTSSMLMGDLNTVSDTEIKKTKNRIEELIQQNPALEKYRGPLMEMLKGTIIPMIKHNGFIDIGEDAHICTIPSKLAMPYGPFLRLDYILKSENITTTNFTTYSGGVFEEASDHYPVSVEIA